MPGRGDVDALGAAHRVDARRVFAHELAALAQFAAHGHVTLEPQGFRVTPTGWTVVRAVAMVFDRYLQPGGGFSRGGAGAGGDVAVGAREGLRHEIAAFCGV